MKRVFSQFHSYIGNEDQLMPVHDGRLIGGRQEGVRFIEVGNGGNLSVTVLPDRAMDLYQVRYKGKSMNYIAPCGITAPTYYDAHGDGWLRGFFAGMLTTVGLQNIGNSGGNQGLHGRIAHTPAEQVRISRELIEGKPGVTLEGIMREAQPLGENLRLHRKLQFVYERDEIILVDTITNCAFTEQPFFYGLHLNFGYPLLDEETELNWKPQEIVPRNDYAAKFIDKWMEITPPDALYEERCYYHKMDRDQNANCRYEIYHPKRKLGVCVQYPGEKLPWLCQWKMLQKGSYILGIEPYNAPLDGPKLHEPGCYAPILAPGEQLIYEIRLTFFSEKS